MPYLRPLFVCVAMTLASSCVERQDAEEEPNPAVVEAVARIGDGRVVLVTIDGVRWQDVFFGSDVGWSHAPSVPAAALLPNLYRLTAERGVRIGGADAPCGTVHTTGKSNVSLPGYLEIFTGRPSHCLDNQCARTKFSVMDQAMRGGVVGVVSVASWEPLGLAVTRDPQGGVLVATGRDWPVDVATERSPLPALIEAGAATTRPPSNPSYRPDATTIPIALETYRQKQPDFYHVGLGDTDEWGHKGDYPSYLLALMDADRFIGELAKLVEARDGFARTTVIVTPDHGRESGFDDHGPMYPESGRTFLFAFGAHVEAHGDSTYCPKGDITLTDITATMRALLGLVADPSADAGVPIAPIVSGPMTEEPPVQ